MNRKIELTVDETLAGAAVGEILRRRLSVSARLLAELKRTGGILLNGVCVPVCERAPAGSVISVSVTEQEGSDAVVPEALPLKILYEDEDILAVDKEKDMPVHPSLNHYTHTLGNAVMHYYLSKNEGAFVFRPITRLDRDTTGIVLIAKNKLSACVLSDAMRRGKIEKSYLALLSRTPAQREGTVSVPIAREADSIIKRCPDPDGIYGGKSAVTRWRVEQTFDDGTCAARLFPYTGRTHQIRVHMAYIGCPLLYDYLYGSEIPGKTLFLHCALLTFPHPATGRVMRIESESGFCRVQAKASAKDNP